MTNKQIVIDDYFNIMRDENGRIFGIQEIGDSKSLIKAIREQNEYIQTKEQECKGLKKELAKVYKDIKLSPLCYKCDEEECLQKEIDKLKADNEMLRDELRFYKDFYYAHS